MLSVIVITKNEERMIEACLESVKWADEVIVADNSSTDKTLEIAKKYTKKIFVFQGENFAGLRNKATEKASGDWVLYVDADERVLAPLKEEILQLIINTDYSAFAISRRNIIFGQEVKYGPFWPDWVVRLIKKENLEGWTGKIHEQPKYGGKLGYTRNSFLHLTHRDIDQVVLKSLEWSKIDARLRIEAGHPQMSGWRFLRVLVGELFNQGIKRRGFFAGTVGTIDALLQTFSLVITYIRLWQLQQHKLPEELYKDLDQKLVTQKFNY